MIANQTLSASTTTLVTRDAATAHQLQPGPGADFDELGSRRGPAAHQPGAGTRHLLLLLAQLQHRAGLSNVTQHWLERYRLTLSRLVWRFLVRMLENQQAKWHLVSPCALSEAIAESSSLAAWEMFPSAMLAASLTCSLVDWSYVVSMGKPCAVGAFVWMHALRLSYTSAISSTSRHQLNPSQGTNLECGADAPRISCRQQARRAAGSTRVRDRLR